MPVPLFTRNCSSVPQFLLHFKMSFSIQNVMMQKHVKMYILKYNLL